MAHGKAISPESILDSFDKLSIKSPRKAILLESVLDCFDKMSNLADRSKTIRADASKRVVDLIIIGYEHCPFSKLAVQHVSEYMKAILPVYQRNPKSVTIAPNANRTMFVQVSHEEIDVLRKCLGYPDFTLPMVFVRNNPGMTFIGGADRLQEHLSTFLKKASMIDI